MISERIKIIEERVKSLRQEDEQMKSSSPQSGSLEHAQLLHNLGRDYLRLQDQDNARVTLKRSRDIFSEIVDRQECPEVAEQALNIERMQIEYDYASALSEPGPTPESHGNKSELARRQEAGKIIDAVLAMAERDKQSSRTLASILSLQGQNYVYMSYGYRPQPGNRLLLVGEDDRFYDVLDNAINSFNKALHLVEDQNSSNSNMFYRAVYTFQLAGAERFRAANAHDQYADNATTHYEEAEALFSKYNTDQSFSDQERSDNKVFDLIDISDPLATKEYYLAITLSQYHKLLEARGEYSKADEIAKEFNALQEKREARKK